MDLIIHIGLPKTGSTFLQQHLFAGRTGYLGRSKENDQLIDKKTLLSFSEKMCLHRFISPREGKKIAQDFVQILTTSKEIKNCDHLLWSEEILSSWFLHAPKSGVNQDERHEVGRRPVGLNRETGQIRQRPHPFADFLRDYLVPEFEPHGKVRIVLILRNQPDWLASLYAQKSKYIRNASQKNFEKQVEHLLIRKDPSIDWSALVEDFEDAVGRNQINILLYEEMGALQFWEQVERSFHLNELPKQQLTGGRAPRENVKKTHENTWGISPRSLLLPSKIIARHWPIKMPGKSFVLGGVKKIVDRPFEAFHNGLFERRRTGAIQMSHSLRSRIRDHCKYSNTQLARRLDRDIERLGY